MVGWMAHLRASITLLLVSSVLLGVVYPALVTLVGQTLFPYQAHGSLITEGSQVIGSALIGQPFDDPKYFWGRLSATTPPYNAAASQGSNRSPANPEILNTLNLRLAALQKADPKNTSLVPVDLVTTSASGLDPHISVVAANYQIARVARLRKMPEDEIRKLVEQSMEGRTLGFIGEPRVNVLLLNTSLDKLHSAAKENR